MQYQKRKNAMKNNLAFGIAFVTMWIVTALAAIAIPVTIGVIVFHFASKFW
jgi:hypothetical protein